MEIGINSYHDFQVMPTISSTAKRASNGLCIYNLAFFVKCDEKLTDWL